MGQKVNPIGFRVGVNRKWVSNWYNPKAAPEYLAEDKRIRDAVMRRYRGAAIAELNIERSKEDRVSLVVRSARPGIVIGRGGSEIARLQKDLEALTGKTVKISIKEIERPDLEAALVAQEVAQQIESRIVAARAIRK